MVSEPFNIITNQAPLVRFILSLSFAHVLSTSLTSSSPLTAQSSLSTVDEDTSVQITPASSPLSAQSSQSTITGDIPTNVPPLHTSVDYDFAWKAHGYDPSMQRIGHGIYRVRVGDTWYITEKTLSDSRAERICGRCTRVWQVYEDKKYNEGEEKIYYVLKDVWIDSSIDTEATIWKRLKEKVDPKVFEQHFLTLVAAFEPGESATTCGFLGRDRYSHAENADFMDSQFIDMLDFEPLPTGRNTPPGLPINNRFHIQGPDLEPSTKAARKRVRYHARTHDRSVWKELCSTYHDQVDIQIMFKMLGDAVEALRAMWKDAHAIHRDISTGNILYDGKNGRLGDLEYVTFYDDKPNTTHNVKTGTLQFMAVEVLNGRYHYRDDEDDPFLVPIPASASDTPDHPFRHNVLHDLESIWWLVMWTILSYIPDSFVADAKNLADQENACYSLFSSDLSVVGTERRNALEDKYPDFAKPVAESPFKAACSLVLHLRNTIRRSYRAVEKTLPIKSDCPTFLLVLDATMGTLEAMKTSLGGITNVTRVTELIRKRKADTKGVQEEEPPRKK